MGDDKRRLLRKRAAAREDLARAYEEYGDLLEEDLLEEKQKIKAITVEFKKRARQRRARRTRRLEAELRMALRMGKKAEVQRLLHLLAGRSRGTRKNLQDLAVLET